jgi:hypothetical protein
MPVEPTQEQIAEIAAKAGTADDGPVIMLNLNRYLDRDEYLRYLAVASQVLDRVGGRVHWHTTARQTVVGTPEETWDEVIAIWYPSRAAFLELATAPEAVAVHHHRVAGLERAALVCCDA